MSAKSGMFNVINRVLARGQRQVGTSTVSLSSCSLQFLQIFFATRHILMERVPTSDALQVRLGCRGCFQPAYTTIGSQRYHFTQSRRTQLKERFCNTYSVGLCVQVKCVCISGVGEALSVFSWISLRTTVCLTLYTVFLRGGWCQVFVTTFVPHRLPWLQSDTTSHCPSLQN